jgi:hypothetical protein
VTVGRTLGANGPKVAARNEFERFWSRSIGEPGDGPAGNPGLHEQSSLGVATKEARFSSKPAV